MFSTTLKYPMRDVVKGTLLGTVIGILIDGRQYVPVPEGMNPMMEPTFVVDKDYYR